MYYLCFNTMFIYQLFQVINHRKNFFIKCKCVPNYMLVFKFLVISVLQNSYYFDNRYPRLF